MTARGRRAAPFALVALCLGALPTSSSGAPPEAPDALAARLAAAYLARDPVPAAPVGLSLGGAYYVQGAFVAALTVAYGNPVGYKAGLTSPAARARFGAKEPLSGVLLARMLMKDGASLPASYGARPAVEADLLVRVGSAAINEAHAHAEILAALEAVIPFIELPDLAYAVGTAPDAAAIAAVNVGARHGVLGKPIPLAPGTAWEQRLGAFRVRLEDGDGNALAEGAGKDLLGHPLSAVRWLRDDLAARGIALQAGDLLSLGTVAAPVPAGPGTYTATYTGLDPAGQTRVRVTLKP